MIPNDDGKNLYYQDAVYGKFSCMLRKNCKYKSNGIVSMPQVSNVQIQYVMLCDPYPMLCINHMSASSLLLYAHDTSVISNYVLKPSYCYTLDLEVLASNLTAFLYRLTILISQCQLNAWSQHWSTYSGNAANTDTLRSLVWGKIIACACFPRLPLNPVRESEARKHGQVPVGTWEITNTANVPMYMEFLPI